MCDNIWTIFKWGNVYVKYFRESDADRALKTLTGRFYDGRPVVAEFSPVTNFREHIVQQCKIVNVLVVAIAILCI